MRTETPKGKRMQFRGKKNHHWAILTLDDLDKTKWKHSSLVADLQAEYRAGKELAKDISKPKPVDFAIQGGTTVP